MSEKGLRGVLARAEDESFRKQLSSDPDAALREYDLTDEERKALLSGDFDQLGKHISDEPSLSAWFRVGP